MKYRVVKLRTAVIAVPFSMSRAVKQNEVKGFKLKIRNIQGSVYSDSLSAIKYAQVKPVKDENGFIVCSVEEKGLCGTRIVLSFPSVGATENIILASTLAKGTTVISNAAREPEIIDLADFLNRCGAKIYGAGDSTITVEGVSRLHSAEHTIIPDRIVASTYMIAAAMTGGKVSLNNVIPSHLGPIIQPLRESGCQVDVKRRNVSISSSKQLKRIKMIRTMPHPGFPTDVQAQMMALTTIADGTSVFIENIFETHKYFKIRRYFVT